MAPTPIIRARRRRDLGLTDLATSIAKLGPEIELGWNHLLDELRDAGWPTRTPEDDRRPHRSRPVARCACGEQFTTIDAANVHTDETGHDDITETEPPDTSSLDYADPTGDLAGQLYSKHNDADSLNEHLEAAITSLRALHLIATRHRPASSTATPGCIIPNCDQPVESKILPGGQRTYIGMEQIAGCWVAKIGATPTCARHRKRRDSGDAA